MTQSLFNSANQNPADPVGLVRIFNLTAGQVVRDEPTANIEEEQLRFDLIKEEIGELVEKGLMLEDIVETIDACADIVYVVAGAALSYGITRNVEGNEILPGIEICRSSGFLKIDFWEDHQMRHAFAENMRRNLLALHNLFSRKVVIIESPKDQRYPIVVERDVDFLYELTNIYSKMIEDCYTIAATYKVDLDKVLEEVQASNMSKFGPNGEVYRHDTGKVKKGPNYFIPNIAAVLTAQGVATGWVNPDAYVDPS